MAKGETLKKDCGIVFGDWRLMPVDSKNWELCRFRESETADGTVKRWMRCGLYYQYNTVGNALMYAADQELKAGCAEAAGSIESYLAEYREIAESFQAAVREAMA